MRTVARAVLVAVALAAPLAAPSAQAFVWPSTVDRVSRDLGSTDLAVRRKAAVRLFALPRAVIGRLGPKALADGDPDVRVAALEALLSIHAPGLGQRVAPWLGDTEPRVRRAAASALSRQPYAEVVPALGRVLSDPDANVRLEAARALGISGAPAALVPLLGRLDDSEPEVREAVVRSLSRLGDKGAVVPLIGKIQDARPNVRQGVATALGVLGDPRAESALLLALRDPDETVRVAALGALGRIHAASAAATVASLLATERRPVVREAALGALAELPAPTALDALVRALGEDDPRERSPVRAALVHAGDRAVPKLTRCLEGQPAFDLADGCALALGEIHHASVAEDGSAAVIEAALRRGVVRPAAALNALGVAGDDRALATVFEYLSADDAWVRRAATGAALALLEPTEPDGRAVEPIARALDAAHDRRSERSALVELLGRTGSPRAVPILVRIAQGASDAALRLAAVTALGSLGRSGQDDALLKALSDDDARTRVAAALALRKTASAASAAVLMNRLERSAEEDRDALAVALYGPLSQASSERDVTRATELARRESPPRRAALVEAVSAAPGALGSAPLIAWARVTPDPTVRAKIAEGLANHPEATPSLRALARDADASVRANAAWALGSVATPTDTAALEALLADEEPAVAGNAAAALGRLLERGTKVAAILCRATSSPHAYVRVNALAGLALGRARCDGGAERALLGDDVPLVRKAAAQVLAISSTDADRARLSRCAEEETSADVAAACAGTPSAPLRDAGPVTVYVVPAGQTEPLARAAFALVRPDGYVRLGYADARGAVFESAVPRGTLSLALPAPLQQ